MDGLIKIKDMIGRYGISARTLRYYEDMGLLDSVRKDGCAYRLYEEPAVKRLEQILILRRLNISIRDIRRVFGSPGSDAVLGILDKKVSDIDGEVALLHELKEVVLEFISQIKGADFGSEGDVKLLYEKAMDIETRLANVDYDGNSTNMNRLMKVAERLEKKPEIIKRHAYVYLIFNLGSRQNVIDAVELYQEAFNAEITSRDELTGGDGWIGMNIRMFDFGIWVQSNESPSGTQTGCCISFPSEDELRGAYDVLSREARECELNYDWGWTSLSALLTDKFGVNWLFAAQSN